MQENKPLKKPITNDDLIKQVEAIKQQGYGRVEAVIGEHRIVEINIGTKIKEN